MPETPVVTCFLLRRGRAGDRILLLQRSPRVGTYRGHWAGVSGYLEATDPLEQAYRELAEEVGLGRQDVRLLARGHPLPIPHPERGRRWLVHPFLFEALNPKAIRLDWEHLSGRWIRPTQIFDYRTVPMLPEALMRVYPLVSDRVRQVVERIRTDREHGARQLAAEALHTLADMAAQADPEALRTAARALARSRPSMAAVANAVAAAYAAAATAPQPAPAVEAVLRGLQRSPESMSRIARSTLPAGTIMTYSYSSTVLELLTALGPPRVIVSEGRPLYEGHTTARALAERGIPVTLITEAQMGLFLGEARAVVVGADTVFPDGSFANKAGTRLLALAAREARVPFYVVAETLKVASTSGARWYLPEEGDPREVLPEDGPPLETRNLYFEITPARLITAFITEEGLAAPREMRRYARRAEARWRALFGRARTP